MARLLGLLGLLATAAVSITALESFGRGLNAESGSQPECFYSASQLSTPLSASACDWMTSSCEECETRCVADLQGMESYAEALNKLREAVAVVDRCSSLRPRLLIAASQATAAIPAGRKLKQVVDLGSLFDELPADIQAAVENAVEDATGSPLPELPTFDISDLQPSDVQASLTDSDGLQPGLDALAEAVRVNAGDWEEEAQAVLFSDGARAAAQALDADSALQDLQGLDSSALGEAVRTANPEAVVSSIAEAAQSTSSATLSEALDSVSNAAQAAARAEGVDLDALPGRVQEAAQDLADSQGVDIDSVLSAADDAVSSGDLSLDSVVSAAEEAARAQGVELTSLLSTAEEDALAVGDSSGLWNLESAAVIEEDVQARVASAEELVQESAISNAGDAAKAAATSREVTSFAKSVGAEAALEAAVDLDAARVVAGAQTVDVAALEQIAQTATLADVMNSDAMTDAASAVGATAVLETAKQYDTATLAAFASELDMGSVVSEAEAFVADPSSIDVAVLPGQVQQEAGEVIAGLAADPDSAGMAAVVAALAPALGSTGGTTQACLTSEELALYKALPGAEADAEDIEKMCANHTWTAEEAAGLTGVDAGQQVCVTNTLELKQVLDIIRIQRLCEPDVSLTTGLNCYLEPADATPECLKAVRAWVGDSVDFTDSDTVDVAMVTRGMCASLTTEGGCTSAQIPQEVVVSELSGAPALAVSWLAAAIVLIAALL